VNVALFLDPLTPHFAEDRLFGEHPYGDYNAPFIHVKEVFEARGIPVHTGDFLLRGEHVAATNVYFAIGNVRNFRRVARRGDTILSGLFHIEAPIVHPTTYRRTPEASTYFKRVYSFSSPEALAPFGCGGLSLIKYCIPEPYDAIFEDLSRRRDRGFLTMITHNKLPTMDWNELYTERLRLLEHFSRSSGIDLYGIGWSQLPFRVGEPRARPLRTLERAWRFCWERIPFTRNHPYEDVIKRVYRGPVASKYETMSRYTFAICYENMILEGWINEKIFDAFLVGTIPIYLGAPDITDYVPADCFIDPRRFATYAELEEFLLSLGEREIEAYRENARAFMASDAYQPFTKQAFADLFVRAVEEDLGVAA